MSDVNNSSSCFPGDTLLLCVGAALQEVVENSEGQVGTSQNPRCYLCHQLLRAKARNGKWPRVKHHPRCPKQPSVQSEAASAAAASPAAFQRSHKRRRRAESDPGEPLGARSPSPPSVRPSTHRVTPPTRIAAHKKPRTTRQDDRIMRLLDETHARRMAAETAATAAAAAARTLAAAGGAADSRGASQ